MEATVPITRWLLNKYTFGGDRGLLREHDLESACNATKASLKDQVFESTFRTKILFPEVFEALPT